jgi:hypothetical protein
MPEASQRGGTHASASTSGANFTTAAAAVGGVVATAAAAAGAYLLWRRYTLSKLSGRSTTTSARGGPMAYETPTAVEEYLQMHFAPADDIFPYADAPKVCPYYFSEIS